MIQDTTATVERKPATRTEPIWKEASHPRAVAEKIRMMAEARKLPVSWRLDENGRTATVEVLATRWQYSNVLQLAKRAVAAEITAQLDQKFAPPAPVEPFGSIQPLEQTNLERMFDAPAEAWEELARWTAESKRTYEEFLSRRDSEPHTARCNCCGEVDVTLFPLAQADGEPDGDFMICQDCIARARRTGIPAIIRGHKAAELFYVEQRMKVLREVYDDAGELDLEEMAEYYHLAERESGLLDDAVQEQAASVAMN